MNLSHLCSHLNSEAAQQMIERVIADTAAHYHSEAVMERTISYWERVTEAQQQERKPDLHSLYENVFNGWRTKHQNPPKWQEEALHHIFMAHFQEGKGVLIIGETGTGKTSIFEYMKTFPEIVFRIRTGYELKQLALNGGMRAVDEVGKAKAIMLDDIGLDGAPLHMGTEVRPVDQIIHYRYGRRLTTHGTMNAEALTKLDKRTSDRLKEMCHFIFADGKSFR